MPTIAEMAFKLKLTSSSLEEDKMITSERLRVRKEPNWMIYIFYTARAALTFMYEFNLFGIIREGSRAGVKY